MATRRTIIACCRLLSSCSTTVAPRLLGHFHQPGQTKDVVGEMYPIRSVPDIRFEPFAAASPCLSRDFLPLPANTRLEFSLADSHLGLILLRSALVPTFLVCDPVSHRHTLFPPLLATASMDGNIFFGPAILSRVGGRFEFDAIVITIQDGRMRPWVVSFRVSGCSWRTLPRTEEVEIMFNPFWIE
ncbi:hypothetical protein QOZ80_6BG0476520 [Eleusine coracana subsp. coracana]|nr:hypothetical protein QOZ80_6BG0476520 [Eleusine coracana subsp. coracana]